MGKGAGVILGRDSGAIKEEEHLLEMGKPQLEVTKVKIHIKESPEFKVRYEVVRIKGWIIIKRTSNHQ